MRVSCLVSRVSCLRSRVSYFWVKHRQQRFPCLGLEQRFTAVDRRAKGRLGGIKCMAHVHILGTLAGEKEGEPPLLLGRHAVHNSCGRLTLGNRSEFSRQVGLVGGDNGQALAEMATPHRRVVT